jgi:ribosomal protein S18 acetylase RimI-like enzyme
MEQSPADATGHFRVPAKCRHGSVWEASKKASWRKATAALRIHGVSTLAIDIRPARLQDAEAITAVHDETWRTAYLGIIPGGTLARMINRRGVAWWEGAIDRGSRIQVVTVAGVLAGYGSFGRNRALALSAGGEIYELYVRPDYQGMGLGRRLFSSCRREIASRGLEGLAVWALAENDLACAFYRALGGVAAARGTERFGDRTIDKIAFTWS